MFQNIISKPKAFSSAIMNKINIGSYALDPSVSMTMIALLYNRVDDLKINIVKVEKDDGIVVIDNFPSVYSVYWFFNHKSEPDTILKPVKTRFKSIEKLPTHEKFLSEKLNQKIGIRFMPNENTVCFFVDKCTVSAWHCLPFIFPKLFPIFKQKPLTEEETSFLESLTYKTSRNYITRINELTNKEEFKRFALKIELESFEKHLFDRKVSAAENNLKSIEEQMEVAMLNYRKANEKRLEAVALLSGLKSMADQKEDSAELQNYLINNQRISDVRIDNTSIEFIVKTFLAPHHIEEWDTISKNNRFFEKYSHDNVAFKDFADIKRLLDAIFSENRCLKLKMCAYFNLDYFGSYVNSQSRYDYSVTSAKDYIPNPHLYLHNCFGQNKIVILDQLKEGDAIGAIECCISCAQKINIHESMTFDPFVRYLLASKQKCLVTKDNEELTPEEALLYLKGNNNE